MIDAAPRPRRTRNPQVWLEYACWKVSFWMMCHKPIMPGRLRTLILLHYPDAKRRWSVDRKQYDFWLQGYAGRDPERRAKLPRPLPWPICRAALGPLYDPWNRARHWFSRHTGGRSMRCEFTDPEQGALYDLPLLTPIDGPCADDGWPWQTGNWMWRLLEVVR